MGDPRCAQRPMVAIDNFGDSAGRLDVIALDNKNGYQQITLRYRGQEKLAFSMPDNSKWCFGIMPFGPHKAPAFYTSMMRIFKSELQAL